MLSCILHILCTVLVNTLFVDACAPTRGGGTTTIGTTTPVVTTTAMTTTTTPITTTTAPACTAPANTVGITIDQVSGIVENGIQTPATAHCRMCTESKRNFYTSVMTNDANNEIANPAFQVECQTTQLCLCNSANACCSPATDAAAPTQIRFVPFCDNTGCQMNAVLETTATTLLVCDGVTYNEANQMDANGFRPLNSGAYFNTDRVSCRGCNNIQTNKCIGPTETGPA
ncbi:hypothetical protein M3Y96_00999200 [Aphelenchoides besseyi]|nr:hypothetical protein M3Y96_00999200 [Aphelenchoides besseyi]